MITGMKWSLRLISVAGIGIFIHWTFSILLIFLFFFFLSAADGDVRTALTGILLIMGLFLCVVLHELGHALCARRYGIGTRDITLLPIGGLARLERMPTEPKQEFWIAVAGPAVNVVIAALCFVLILAVHGAEALAFPVHEPGEIFILDGIPLAVLMWMNVILVGFNALPAFPMDGGRVLRAILATRMQYHKATRAAATVGQGMALFFGLSGLLVLNPFLVFIAIFVFLGAQAEAHYAETRYALHGLKVRDAMLTHFRALGENDTLGDAVDELLAGSQQDFPILRNDEVIGLLTRHNLMQTLSDHDRNAPVTEGMIRTFETLSEDDELETLQEKLREGFTHTMPVMKDGRLTGLLTRENLAELIMIHSALEESGHGAQMRDILHRGRQTASGDDIHAPFIRK